MRIRYPEGFASVIDADLSLTGHHGRAAASGNGDGPRRALFEALRAKRGSLQPDRSRGALRRSAAAGADAAADVRRRRSMRLRRCASRTTSRSMVASADLKLQGTYDHPVLFGTRADRARRHHLRGQPLRRDARQHRVRQPGRGSSRTSTSRRRRACACPRGRSTASRSDSPARPRACLSTSIPIRRCRASALPCCCSIPRPTSPMPSCGR